MMRPNSLSTDVSILYKRAIKSDMDSVFYNEQDMPQCFYHVRVHGFDLFIRRTRMVYEVFSNNEFCIQGKFPKQRYRLNEKEFLYYVGRDFDKALTIFSICAKHLVNAYLPDTKVDIDLLLSERREK